MKNYISSILSLLMPMLLCAQSEIAIDATIQHPVYSVDAIGYKMMPVEGQIVRSKETPFPFYMLDKQDWEQGEVYQLAVEPMGTKDSLYCYWFSSQTPVEERIKQVPFKIAAHQKVELPALREGFTLRQIGEENVCFLLSKQPIPFKQPKATDFMPAVLSTLPNFDGAASAKNLNRTLGGTLRQGGILPLFIKFTVNRKKPTKGETLHGVLVGPPFRDLAYTGKDALDVAEVLRSKNVERSFSHVEITSYTDSLVTTKTAIEAAILKIKEQYKRGKIQPNDMILLLISSHGFIVDDELYIQASNTDLGNSVHTSVNYTDIYLALKNIPCAKVVLLDVSASPASWEDQQVSYSPESPIRPLMEERFYTMLSNGVKEYSYESPQWENGAFTEAIIEGLTGKADTDDDGWIYFSELFRYVANRTPDLVQEVYQKPQTPTLPRAGFMDIPLVRVR